MDPTPRTDHAVEPEPGAGADHSERPGENGAVGATPAGLWSTATAYLIQSARNWPLVG
jgi:hypothetical protein